MELAAIAAQQSLSQLKVATTMVKQASDTQNKIAEMIQQTATPPSGSRGQNLNITV